MQSVKPEQRMADQSRHEALERDVEQVRFWTCFFVPVLTWVL